MPINEHTFHDENLRQIARGDLLIAHYLTENDLGYYEEHKCEYENKSRVQFGALEVACLFGQLDIVNTLLESDSVRNRAHFQDNFVIKSVHAARIF